MEIRHEGKYSNINIGEMGLEIDDIFHEYITKKTNITISHDKIYHFIGELIQEHNKDEIRKERVLEELTAELDSLDKENNEKSKTLKHKLLKFLSIKV